MCRPAFEALDRSWATLTRSPEAAAALERWRSEPGACRTRPLHHRRRGLGGRPAGCRPGSAALAARAPTDPTAARVLLQVLRPGLRSLGRRLALGGSFDDVDQELLALAWERIRTYSVDRRPSSVAANILLDVRKRYVRAVLEPSIGRISLEDLPEVRWPVAPSAEHDALDAEGPSLRRAHARLVAAIDSGAITRGSAGVWRTRVQQDDDAEVAAELGVAVRTLQRRRQRAERLLAAS